MHRIGGEQPQRTPAQHQEGGQGEQVGQEGLARGLCQEDPGEHMAQGQHRKCDGHGIVRPDRQRRADTEHDERPARRPGRQGLKLREDAGRGRRHDGDPQYAQRIGARFLGVLDLREGQCEQDRRQQADIVAGIARNAPAAGQVDERDGQAVDHCRQAAQAEHALAEQLGPDMQQHVVERRVELDARHAAPEFRKVVPGKPEAVAFVEPERLGLHADETQQQGKRHYRSNRPDPGQITRHRTKALLVQKY